MLLPHRKIKGAYWQHNFPAGLRASLLGTEAEKVAQGIKGGRIPKSPDSEESPACMHTRLGQRVFNASECIIPRQQKPKQVLYV